MKFKVGDLVVRIEFGLVQRVTSIEDNGRFNDGRGSFVRTSQHGLYWVHENNFRFATKREISKFTPLELLFL